MATIETVQQVFKAMVDEFDPDAVGDMDAVLQFDISGDDGGQWVVKIADQQIEVNEGETSDATTTLRMADKDFLGIVNGDLNAVSAFMQGLIKIEGDMSVAMKLQSLLGA
jgi:putative sterol carrier protein